MEITLKWSRQPILDNIDLHFSIFFQDKDYGEIYKQNQKGKWFD